MPPTNVIPADAKIRVVFKGFIITRIKDGPNPDGTNSAWVGALASTLDVCHRPKVHVYQIKIATGETTQITKPINPDQDFSISVVKESPNIRTFQRNPFDQSDDERSHPKDFRWFVNFNKIHRLTGTGANKVEVIPDTLKPIFTINDGLFHASDRSDRKAKVRRRGLDGVLEPNTEPFGKFALEITARIYLEGRETAEFTNGASSIFNASASPAVDPFRYHIVYDCSCLNNEDISDFEKVYQAIKIPDGIKRLRLEPDPPLDFASDFKGGESTQEADLSPGRNLAASPETYCTGGTFP